ncbi:hypothetical protein AMAG_00925 [Allomyces macrogynus ATCC 38327]|uniref:Uncharacterized protein n=1 Tax=Allomyces macrogynus (strain ATCC 38327) TaxID=578462 RepID=A0A0L0RXE1_ALLM3|nr:hypothetical protein AMAG_00925 [Allomyces macrogynus ATCC 38327]|eukprot:KNE54988.1 hypothetical protein AMAG_00925 [Allomyces macrogynus ATCC 38327]
MIDPLPPTTGPAACPAMPGAPPASPLIYLLFAECAYSRVEAASVVLGYASVLCWVGAQMPQVLQNWRRQSAAGLAIPFIAVWLLGDVANYLGSALTHQRPFQVLLAAYFCFVDAALLVQCLWYNHRAAASRPRPTKSASPSMTTALAAASAVASFAAPHTRSRSCSPRRLRRRRSPRLSARRVGLAMGMVACAVAGNATYAASVALRGMTVADVGEYWAAALPFFMGSAGTLAMDAALIAQWWCWRDASGDEEEVTVVGDADEEVVVGNGKLGTYVPEIAVDVPPASSSAAPLLPPPRPPVPVAGARRAAAVATERTPLLARTWPEL